MNKLIENDYERRALVLDDDEANRMLLSVAAGMGKLEVAQVHTGEAALALWQPGKYAFAFLDIELPGMSGLEVARRMRAQDVGMVLIMCSANDDPAIIEQAATVDADIFLIKPYRIDTLLSMIRVLDRSKIRANPRLLIVDNTARPRWVDRPQHTTRDL